MNDPVADWLERFDRSADVLPPSRRDALRAELVAHLDEAVPADATEAQSAEALDSLGDPRDIVDEELSAPHVHEPRRWPTFTLPPRRTLIAILATVGFSAVAVTLGLIWVASDGPKSLLGEPRNVVTSHPEGPARTTEGRAYQEYLATIEGLDPLPPGAAWPYGVPAGLDAGPTDDGEGTMAAGAGVVTANFTWACAWEYEYVLAERAGDDERLVDAYDAIVAYGDSPMMREASPDGGWIADVVTPLEFEDSDGLKQDVVRTCEDAGILGLYQLVYHPDGV